MPIINPTTVPITTTTMGRLFMLAATMTALSCMALIFEAVLGLQQVPVRYIVATLLSAGFAAGFTNWTHQRLLDAQARADAADRAAAKAADHRTPPEWRHKGDRGRDAGSGEFGGPRREPPE
jgi:uncharacterized membrane protein